MNIKIMAGDIALDAELKDSAIYCLGRNEQREKKYKWVGVYFHQ